MQLHQPRTYILAVGEPRAYMHAEAMTEIKACSYLCFSKYLHTLSNTVLKKTKESTGSRYLLYHFFEPVGITIVIAHTYRIHK